MKYTKKILPNGLTVVTISDISTQASTISVYLRAGFRFDPENRPGLSHFSEHMVFNAIKNLPKYSSLVEAVERCGGWRSAFTWIENQKHTIHLPKDHFEDAVKLLLKTLFEPIFNSSEVQKEKGVVKEEILKNKSDPAIAIWDYAWLPLIFQGTKLTRPYSGTPEDLASISDTDVKTFLSQYFQPNNTVILVAGSLEPSYVQQIINKYSKEYKKSRKKTTVEILKPEMQRHVFVHKDPSYYRTSLAIGIKTVSFTSPLKHTFDLLIDMLAGYHGVPLIQKLRDEGGLIYAWNYFHDNLTDMGYFHFKVATDHKNVKPVTAIVLKEFKRFAQGKFTKEEFETAKSHLSGSVLVNTESSQNYNEFYGLQELLNPNHILHIEDKIKKYKSITMQEAKKVASKYFVPENIFIAAVGTADEKELESLLQTERQ